MTSVLSPFQQHREKIRLLQQDKSTLVDAKQNLHIVNAELERDLKYLKSLPCIEDKVSYKRGTLLPKWLPQVEKYLQGGQVYSNVIFVYCTVWLFDIGDFDRGIEFAEIATNQNQTTPAHWSMTIPGFVCKAVFDWSESTAANGHSIEPYFSKVFEIIKSGKWRIYETDRADWYKLAGLNLLRDEKGNIQNASAFEDITLLEKVKELLITANALSSKVGVKTRITEIESRINALTK